ncbi:MAG: cation:proton antiporter [Alphaproteobacteria bacterium]|nr:cation:proton antiporter [Alphaproteobacteria bacterium]
MHHFSEILTLLGIASIAVPFLHRLGVSPVLGYLLCGIVAGPYGLALWSGEYKWIDYLTVRDNETIRSFANLGIIFLMFMIGLKLSLDDLWRMRHHILGLGGCQVLLTGSLIFFIVRWFGNSPEISILLGACFALSSTAVVMQLFEEKQKVHTPVGRLSFSILLMQDLAVVPILALLTAFAMNTGENLAFLIVRALLTAAATIVVIYFIGMKILRPLLRHLNPDNRAEWLMAFVLFLVIGTATLTEFYGLSAALGAFLAGLLLAETEYKRKIVSIIFPVEGLLIGMFFLSVGMMMDIRAALYNPLWLIVSVAGVGLLKAVILFLLCLAFKVKKDVAAETAIMLGQGSEFVFVIITMALSYKIIPFADAQFFMLVTTLSLVMTPFIALFAPRLARYIARIFPDKR